AEVDVRVAEADLKVAQSEEKRLKAWVGYLTLPAPFDGVIVARNANTFDFVLPTTGDPAADSQVPHLSPSGAAAPIYVVDRTDIVRIFVDIPERPAVRALPVSALTHVGEKTFCWTYQDGRAGRTEVRTGVSDGDWIEVTSLQPPPAADGADHWTPIDGKEQVILGDLSILADGD